MLTAWNQVKCKRLLDLVLPLSNWYDDSMPSIVPAGAPRTDVNVGCENVNELPLAFVAPLRAQYDRHYSKRLVSFEIISLRSGLTAHGRSSIGAAFGLVSCSLISYSRCS